MKMLMRILLYCVGLLFMAFGVAFSVNSNLGVSPVNSLPYVISLILKVDLGRCIIGVILSFLFMHGLFGIRDGTVLSAILVGKILPAMKKRVSPIIQKLCF